jgi:hypothetical protein
MTERKTRLTKCFQMNGQQPVKPNSSWLTNQSANWKGERKIV